MRDPWLGRAVSILAGGGLALFLPPGVRIWGGVLCLLVVGALFQWRPADFFGRLLRAEIWLLAAGLLSGYLYGTVALSLLPSPVLLKDVEVKGVLQDWQEESDRAVGVLRLDSPRSAASAGQGLRTGPAIGGERYRLTVYPDKNGRYAGLWPKVRPGDRLALRANLERPKPAGTPGGFDPRLYDAARGLSGTLTARGEPRLLALGHPSLPWRIREKVRTDLRSFPGGESGILQGILFGDSSGIPPEVQETYKVTGVLHVFAASGSNVAFVLALAGALLFFLPGRGRIIAMALALILYAALCGGSAPIGRAAILGEAVLLGRWGRGKVPALRWLSFAALALFVWNPLVMRDIGFQLSVLAAWGIIVLSPRITRMKILSRCPSAVRQALVATAAAQAATLPLLMAAFHRLSLVGLAANVLILFLLGGVLELGLLGVCLSFSPQLAAVFFQAGLWLLGWANAALKALARLPGADLWVLQPGWAFWLVWYGGIAVWLSGPERVTFVLRVRLRSLRRRVEGVTRLLHAASFLRFWRFPRLGRFPRPDCSPEPAHCEVRPSSLFRLRVWRPSARQLFLLLLVLSLLVHLPQRALEVDFLDVGQGDSLLIRSPQGRVYLIDAGPKSDRFDAGERIVLPYLLHSGVRELEALFITHEHQDHIGGVPAVIKNIPVHWLGLPDVRERLSLPEWTGAIPAKFWQERGKVRTLRAGDRIDMGAGAWFDVLAPLEVLNGTHSDPNNNSLVLQLHYLGETVLLTGDMEEEELRGVAASGSWQADFYKVPHHGSRYSLDEGLLDQLHPRAVFISVGRNTFGHPDPKMLAYWARRRIPLYRTDVEGTIRLLISRDGTRVEVGRK
ncbi:Metallo-beta-lactamase superfamily [Acididesulfobacillus acetoxydans]|uniref:ComEC/Rec2-related protein n=1 Tax=Acididesulfobacillus acetoxydans TaxID=1561005 RepID=A0A8S0WV48_9FIRM|nr:ComEC/Rec2 family competence protein [Acididesulfobacillus acetoxydans]CAA7599391.1 Metallo-beta-lactamase superfamily [Acididesulfobacillus acetoxydans]CEJ06803.1 ComEC/Rec2-related protein [Acididesulfobacillus acetoxydans]